MSSSVMPTRWMVLSNTGKLLINSAEVVPDKFERESATRSFNNPESELLYRIRILVDAVQVAGTNEANKVANIAGSNSASRKVLGRKKTFAIRSRNEKLSLRLSISRSAMVW